MMIPGARGALCAVALLLAAFVLLLCWTFCSRRPVSWDNAVRSCYGQAQLAPGAEPLAQTTYLTVLTPEQCRAIIDAAERLPWQTARHAHYPTTDIATSTAPAIERALLAANAQIIRQACDDFGFRQGELWLRDQFVVKYSPDAQRSLDAHRDASSISYVLALNGQGAYEGGGTAFLSGPTETRVPRRLEAGEAIVFCGKRLHEGRAVTRGTRYIVTGFLDAHAAPETARRIADANPASLRSIVTPDQWDLSPMPPTRPYLRSNTYRLLGAEAAQRGDISAMASANLVTRWPYSLLTSTIVAATKVARRHGTALGEERMHKLFHHFLTEPSECASTYCHMAS